MLQSFINRYIRQIINTRWSETISNEDLWTVTNKQPVDVQMKERKWNWIGHALRKPTGAVEVTALDWKPAREAGKLWNEVKRLATNTTRWRSFTMSYAPEGATETKSSKSRRG
jgi:hypothetical protein